MICIDTRQYCEMLFAAHESITKLACPYLRIGRKHYLIPGDPPCYGPYRPVTVLMNCMLCHNERKFKTGMEMMR